MDMTANQSPWIDAFAKISHTQGAAAWGIVPAGHLPANVGRKMDCWVKAGHHASMDYLKRHLPLKSHPANVLAGCTSVVSLAFPYPSKPRVTPGSYLISRHALSDDYHTTLRRQLEPLCHFIEDTYGGATRICVDSAPVAERYWAATAGVGVIARNGLLYVEGHGSWVFLAEILATAQLPMVAGPASSMRSNPCHNCDACRRACPGSAIGDDGTLDARRCRAYLTIECRDEQLPSGIDLGSRIYGCDICQEVCPLNAGIDNNDTCFEPRPELLNLTPSALASLTPHDFRSLTRGTSMQRITLAQLLRNAQM